MASTSLACYTLRVRKRGEKTYLDASKFTEQGDLNIVLETYLKRWTNYNSDDNKKQVINLKKIQRTSAFCDGIIETGQWGYESTLLDIAQKKVTHKRKTTEAEMLPFFFLYGFQKGKKEGLLILERFGAIGIRKLLSDFLNDEFQKQFPDFLLDINPLVVEEVAKEYLEKGQIIRLSFVSHKIPKDIADMVAKGSEEEISSTELVIHAKRRCALPFNSQLIKLLGGKKSVFELKSFDYDSVRVKVRNNGSTRTIDMENLARLRSYFNIEDGVKKDKSGHPEFESIERESGVLFNEMKRRLQ